MLGLLRTQRTFRLLLIAKTTSFAGDSVLMLALPYFLFVHSGSVISIAGVFILAALPNALLGPVLGGLADRVPPRRLLIGCDLISAMASAALLWVAGGGHRWVIYLAVFVLVSSGQTVNFTRGAVTPRIVAADQLQAANSLESAAMSVVRLAAPPLGGLLYAVVGLGWLVMFNALTFALSAGCVAAVHIPDVAAARSRQSARDRLTRVAGTLHPGGLTGKLVAITGGYFLMGAAGTVLLIPYVRGHFHGGATSVGLLSAAGAIGALIGAVLSLRAQRRLGTLPALGGMLLAEGVTRFGFTTMPSLPTAAVLITFSAACASAFLALLQTALQQASPAGHIGRVIGLTWSIAGTCSILGMLVFSSQSSAVPIQRILQESAVLCMALGLAALVWLPRHQLSSEVQASR